MGNGCPLRQDISEDMAQTLVMPPAFARQPWSPGHGAGAQCRGYTCTFSTCLHPEVLLSPFTAQCGLYFLSVFCGLERCIVPAFLNCHHQYCAAFIFYACYWLFSFWNVLVFQISLCNIKKTKKRQKNFKRKKASLHHLENFCLEFWGMNLNRGGKHNSEELGRPGWPFWGGPTQSQGSLKREAGFGSESLLAWWATAWSLCYVHWHSEIIPPGPPPSSQLKCFLKRPLWVWGHQSGLLRLGGSLLPLCIQYCVYVLYQTFGAHSALSLL